MHYYLLSLKHTNKKDACFTFWGPDCIGYQWFNISIGLYSHQKAIEICGNELINPTTIAIKEDIVDGLFEKCTYEGKERLAIPINDDTLAALGITKSHLQEKHFGTHGIKFSKK